MSTLNGILAPSSAGGGSGDVEGPGAAVTDNTVATWDGTSGTALQDTDVVIEAGVVSAVTQLNVDNLRLDGNTLSSTSGAITVASEGNTGVSITAAGTGRTLLSGGNQNGVGFGSLGSSTGLMVDTFNGGRLYLSRDYNILWNATDASGAQIDGKDTGLARSAAGVVKATDGSVGIRGFLGGGAAVASAAALPLPTGRVFHVTGTTAITSITATNLQAGVVITLIFDDALTFTDGNNLKLAGNFSTSADDTITLVFDGTNFYEICRSVN